MVDGLSHSVRVDLRNLSRKSPEISVLKNIFVLANFKDEGRLLISSINATIIHGNAKFPVIFSPLDFLVAQGRMIFVLKQSLDAPIKFFFNLLRQGFLASELFLERVRENNALNHSRFLSEVPWRMSKRNIYLPQ